jgi:RimJ/RimL family protein N-acetyltransferase
MMPGATCLRGEDVTLAVATEEDIPFLVSSWNDPRVRRTRSDIHPRGPDDIREYLGGTVGRHDGSLALLVCTDGEPVGLVLLAREQPGDDDFRRGELAFWIHPAEWEEGYATAASALLLDHAFGRLGLHRVRARAYADNGPSHRVLEKLGFREEGVDREAAFADGWVDQHRYGLLADGWDGAGAVLDRG